MLMRILLSLCAVLLCLAVGLLLRLLRRQTPQSTGSNDNLSHRAVRDDRADEILWSRDGAYGSAGMSRRRFIPNVIMGSFVVLLFRMVARGMETDWRRSSDNPPHSDSAVARRGDQTPHSDSAESSRWPSVKGGPGDPKWQKPEGQGPDELAQATARRR